MCWNVTIIGADIKLTRLKSFQQVVHSRLARYPKNFCLNYWKFAMHV